MSLNLSCLSRYPSSAFAAVLGLALVFGPARPALAQNEGALRAYFEGRRVTLKIDMPATSEGVDVMVDHRLDFKQHGDRMKRYGVAIRAGETALVTLVKIKRDTIEFQLDGGGFGTFGDDTSTSVNIPSVPKSNREKDLENAVKRENDPGRRRALQRELDDLRSDRERENARIAAERVRAEEDKKRRIAEQRLHGGSRFNIRFDDDVPVDIRPQDVITELSAFIDFGGAADLRAEPRRGAPMPDVVSVGGDGSPRKGLLRAEAERMFGRPVETTERREGAFRVVTLVFIRADQRISAEFVEDVLIRYTISSK